jgi:hypothetical protein
MHSAGKWLQSVALVIALTATWASTPIFAQAPGVQAPPPSFDPVAPHDVESVQGFPIDQFDDFSWRAFIAMVWPADPNNPGEPNVAAQLDDPGPLVFETYRSNWETFQPNGAPPAAWDVAAPISPCPNANIGRNDLLIAGFTKFEELGQAGFGPPLLGPLVAQNGTYVRYTTGYSRTMYDQIARDELYIRTNLGPSVSFADGAVVVKSSWMEMSGVPNPEQYHTRLAWVIDPVTEACAQTLVGLVGLHIVIKTPSRPQWIWSSFEHVNTVPDRGAPQAGRRFDFNNGDGTLMPVSNEFPFPPPVPVPPPFNVERITPIHPDTLETNERWRQALEARNSVWRNYRLVMTQWPITPNRPDIPGTPANTFPGNGDNTAFANVTMETFDQADVDTGCMRCHNGTRRRTDFIWSINTHAAEPPAESARVAAFSSRQRVLGALEEDSLSDAGGDRASLRRLRQYLREAVSDNRNAERTFRREQQRAAARAQ